MPTLLVPLLVLALAAPLQVTVQGAGHQPRVNVHWFYSVHATQGGKPATGRITAVIVDPLGASHPVEFGTSTRKIVNYPFNGTFRDFLEWPSDSRGIPLTLRITVKVASAKQVVDYYVTPRR